MFNFLKKYMTEETNEQVREEVTPEVTPAQEEVKEAPETPAAGSRAAVTGETETPAVVEQPSKPRILDGICEYCGTPAVSCVHYA